MTEPHPADDELDTAVLRSITDEFITAVKKKPQSVRPVADFPESEAVRGLTEAQAEVQQKLQNIMFLTRPPTFDGDE